MSIARKFEPKKGCSNFDEMIACKGTERVWKGLEDEGRADAKTSYSTELVVSRLVYKIGCTHSLIGEPDLADLLQLRLPS